MHVVKVGIVLFDDDLKFPNLHRVAHAVHVMAHVISFTFATLFAIFPVVFQLAIDVTQVAAIPARAWTAAVDLVTRTSRVSSACRARVFAVLAVRSIITELK